MKQGWSTKKDITSLFSDDPADTGEVEPVDQPDSPAIPGSIPCFDPFGVIERLSNGRVRDPIRHALLDLITRSRK